MLARTAAVAAFGLAGCHPTQQAEMPRFEIAYYDRNHDGIVDMELHHAPGWSHGHWWLVDPDFNGCYDSLQVDALGAEPVRVLIPVPGHVRMSKSIPERFRSLLLTH